MNKLAWIALGAAGGALLVMSIKQPTLEGCCWDLAQAARDKISGEGPLSPYIRRALDWSGITVRLPKLIEALRKKEA